MKKRILSLVLTLALLLSFVPMNPAYAADNNKDAKSTSTASTAKISSWAIGDLIVGDNYEIYPISWDSKDMTLPISEENLLLLMGGLRGKLVDTECVKANPDVIYPTSEKMSVEKVLKVYYTLLTKMKFTSDIGIKGKTVDGFMKAAGIYKGTNGEPTLKARCSMEAACVYATRIVTYIYDKLGAASKGFFWVTKSNGNTVYMLGSIHMASSSIYPMSNKILEAYKKSDGLVLELNAFDMNGVNDMIKLGQYNDGTTLKDHVSSDTYQKVVTLAKKYGYTEAVISQCKPWYIDTLFASIAYTDDGNQEDATRAASMGIDMNFMVNAYLYGKPIMEIEGYKYQAQVLDSFSDALDEYMLNDTIDSVNKALNGESNGYSDVLNLMLDLWHDGDTDTFKQYNSYDEDYDFTSDADQKLIDEYNDKLLTARNVNMANYIDQLLKGKDNKTYFVIVGSAHYLDDDSVLDQLKEKGYEITQIK